jgi:hypothetical protein
MIATINRELSATGSLYTQKEGRLYNLRDVLRQEGFEIYKEEQGGEFTFLEARKTG